MIKTNPFFQLKLDKEERAIESAIARGEYRSVKNLKQVKANLKKIAANTLKKQKNVNIRLSEKDIMKLKAVAINEGLPYQTLMASILHKFTKNATC